MSIERKKKDFKSINAEYVLEIYHLFFILEDNLIKLKEKESLHFIKVARLAFEEKFMK